jgi:large subunit ribosomal protein L25
MTTLEYKERGKKDKTNILRKNGLIPAVVYGPKEKSFSITLELEKFKKVWQEVGESGIVELRSGKNVFNALIYDVDLDPLKDIPRHVDFYVFEKGKKIQVKVPLNFVGVAPAVKDLGGVLVKVLHELEVKAEPKDLPHDLAVDISTLTNFKSQILAKDVVLPKGVELSTLPDEVVASIYEPKEEVVEEAPVDLSAIEVQKKGKTEEMTSDETSSGSTSSGTSDKEKK